MIKNDMPDWQIGTLCKRSHIDITALKGSQSLKPKTMPSEVMVAILLPGN